MDSLISASLNDAIGKLIYNVLYRWITNWSSAWTVMGAFSVTVIMFTLFLKILTSPLDIWQKHLARKNARIMEVMKPQLDKITKQCGSNKELLMQKQRALYKQHKYSALSACLPMIITLALFFIIFGGFNSAVRMHNKAVYYKLQDVYDAELDAAKSAVNASPEMSAWTEEQKYFYAKNRASEAVVASYKSEQFFLTKNIFVPDTWSKPVPNAETFMGSGMGKLNISGIEPNRYNDVMTPVMAANNKGWNGYLILPLLVFAINILSMKLNKPPEAPQVAGQTDEQKKAQQSQAKIMQFMMPIIMLIFSLFYSAAFTLYMLVNTALTTVVNLVYTVVTKRIDAKQKDYILSTTFKK